MEMGAIIIFLVGLVAFLAYRHGKGKAEKGVLEGEVQANEQRKVIRSMSDSELDDELRDYWK